MINKLTSIVSPSELYGKLLYRQIRSADAALASIWIRDAHGVFLYAAAGDKCDQIHSELYSACSALAEEAISGGRAVEKRAASRVILAIPIIQHGSAYACSLLWSKTPEGFDYEQTELAKVGAETFSLYLEWNSLAQPEYRLADNCLTLTGVTKRYGEGDGAVMALGGVNLSIRKSELLAILGMSGSGKSTLLNIIGGMTRPTSGRVVTDDTDISNAGSAMLTEYRRQKIGFIFQFYNLIYDLTASENVAMSAGLSKSAMPVEQALDYVGLASKRDKYPAQLSGGEQQRVSIARAIVKRPDFLLCDEPTGALDLDTGKQILRIIDSLVREQRRTVVIVTHCAAIACMADRIVRLVNGRIAEEYINCERVAPDDIEW